MIEVVVVCVILAIIVGVIVPRFSNVGTRRAEASVREFAELISSAAARDQLTGQGVAVDFDADIQRLRLYVPDTDETSKTFRSSGVWRPDQLSRPIDLDGVRVFSATQDLVELPLNWRVEFPRTEPRPRLVVVLEQEQGGARWAVVLSPTATRATITDPDLASLDSDTIDLDTTGQASSSW